jgi:hypothetical protein
MATNPVQSVFSSGLDTDTYRTRKHPLDSVFSQPPRSPCRGSQPGQRGIALCILQIPPGPTSRQILIQIAAIWKYHSTVMLIHTVGLQRLLGVGNLLAFSYSLDLAQQEEFRAI